MKLWKLLLILSLVLFAASARAAGLSVSPENLSFNLRQNETATQSFWVENISAQPALVSVYADALNANFKFQPDTFRLDPGAKKKITAAVSLKNKGLFTTNISVVAQDLDRREFNVATGIKLPIKISVLENNALIDLWKQVVVLTIFVLMILFGLFIVVRHHRKKTLLEKVEDKIDLLKHHRKGWLKKILK